MEIIGYSLAVLMGFVLGLMGGGGSILTVPILVYIFDINASLATGYSLFLVGISAFIATIGHFRQGKVKFKIGFSFAVPAMIGVLLSRAYVVPSLPDPVINLGSFIVGKESFILIAFSVVMIIAAISMIKKNPPVESGVIHKRTALIIIGFEGLIIGFITGFVGAGGGFLIVPALVVMAKLKIKDAIGTSLLIITINSLFGFLGDISVQTSIDWSFLFKFGAIASLGIFFGIRLSSEIPGHKLKKYFGWFVLVMGLAIFTNSIFQ